MSQVLSENVFVVFGSASDSHVYSQILEELKKEKVSFKLRVLSAHRTPKELEKAVSKSKARVFVTGAGLSNALSGVVASKTLKPVIGVPLYGAFGGVDSFLSTVQIPPGISVLSVGIGEVKSAGFHASNIVKGFKRLVLVERRHHESRAAMEKAAHKLEQLGVSFLTSQETNYFNPQELALDFVPLEELPKFEKSYSTAIIVPLKQESSPSDALFFATHARHHLFVGLNRIENGVLGALQLLEPNKKFEKIVKAERLLQKKKVLETDKSESKTHS